MPDMHKVGFVILHYLSTDTTIECIESILRILIDGDRIIVIDNASPNGSGASLFSRYKDNPAVDVVINDYNQGFARANNIGIDIARNRYNTDFVVCVNNDTIVEDALFRDNLIKSFEQYKYGIAGARINQVNNEEYGVCYSKPIHVSLIRARVGKFSFIIRLLLSYLNLDILFSRVFDSNDRVKYSNPLQFRENTLINGCCVIMSPLFFQHFTGFDDRTFMYLEEKILYIKMLSKGLKMCYIPDVQITHLGQVATHWLFSDDKDTARYRRFRYKNTIKSFDVLIDCIKESSECDSQL